MKNKTLVVSYLPSGSFSRTQKLLDAFLNAVRGKTEIETLDLLTQTPDLFSAERLAAYVARNYMGKALDEKQRQLMAGMDRMTARVVSCDHLVLATPMHNFSLPAPVKAFFDAILLKGATWDFAPQGGYAGKMTGKSALLLLTSGGTYEGPMQRYEHAVSLTQILFEFMGFSKIKTLTAHGINKTPDKADALVAEACGKVDAVVRELYGA